MNFLTCDNIILFVFERVHEFIVIMLVCLSFYVFMHVFSKTCSILIELSHGRIPNAKSDFVSWTNNTGVFYKYDWFRLDIGVSEEAPSAFPCSAQNSISAIYSSGFSTTTIYSGRQV